MIGYEPRSEYPFFVPFSFFLVSITLFPALFLVAWPSMKPFYCGKSIQDPEGEPSLSKKIDFYFWVSFNLFNNTLDLIFDAYTWYQLGTSSYAVAASFGLLIVL